jgi:hypothetical protein
MHIHSFLKMVVLLIEMRNIRENSWGWEVY